MDMSPERGSGRQARGKYSQSTYPVRGIPVASGTKRDKGGIRELVAELKGQFHTSGRPFLTLPRQYFLAKRVSLL